VIAAGRLEANAAEILAWTARTFSDKWIVASNMQEAVLIDLAVQAKPDVDVLFVDTGYHFAETIGTRDAVMAVYPQVRIVNAHATQSVSEQETELGLLYHNDPDRCCYLRKVLPLHAALTRYDAWVTGVRRVDAPTRADTPIISWDERHGLVKVNPLAEWTDEQFRSYLDTHGVLENLLVSQGYPSIGCAPCTSRPAPGADPRSGRWAGSAKTECGLHGTGHP
jgi:phosphoadenosine phosphosulfate reductase